MKTWIWCGVMCCVLSVLGPVRSFGDATAVTDCGSYQMDLRGEVRNEGVVYSERLVLRKVTRSGGVQGKWKITLYEQRQKYSRPLGAPVLMAFGNAREQRVDLGEGMWIRYRTVARGDTITTNFVDGKILFDVVGNKIGSQKAGFWCGKIQGKQVTSFKWAGLSGQGLTLKGPVSLGGDNKVSVSIISPEHRDRFVFSKDSTGILTFKARAVVSPEKYGPHLKWEMEEMDESTLKIEPASATGTQVKIIFSGLPEKNEEFGPKTLKAILDVDGCRAVASIKVHLFYPATATNNPKGRFPNWFYYWKQTPAACPNGNLVRLEWGGRTVDQCSNCQVTMLYKSRIHKGGGHKMITVCDLGSLCASGRPTPFTINLPEIAREKIGGNIVGIFGERWRTVSHIDLFASALIHEYQHYLYDEAWKKGKSFAQLRQMDKDWDGIPDDKEPAMGFNPKKPLTFFDTHPVLKGLTYDEEWLAVEAQLKYKNGTYDHYDWACPGKNWPE